MGRPRIPDHLKKGKAKQLDQLGPVQIEQVAKWIERQSKKLPDLIAKMELWLEQHPDDTQAINQIAYWRNHISITRHLAILLRKMPMYRMGEGNG